MNIQERPIVSFGSVKGLVRGRQQQQKGGGRLRESNRRECLIVCLWDYATYLNDSLHTSTTMIGVGSTPPQ
jgi:hypothetical protein